MDCTIFCIYLHPKNTAVWCLPTFQLNRFANLACNVSAATSNLRITRSSEITYAPLDSKVDATAEIRQQVSLGSRSRSAPHPDLTLTLLLSATQFSITPPQSRMVGSTYCEWPCMSLSGAGASRLLDDLSVEMTQSWLSSSEPLLTSMANTQRTRNLFGD